MNEYSEKLMLAKNQQEMRESVAASIYDLLKEKNVSIADSLEILKIAKRLVKGATWKTMLP